MDVLVCCVSHANYSKLTKFRRFSARLQVAQLWQSSEILTAWATFTLDFMLKGHVSRQYL